VAVAVVEATVQTQLFMEWEATVVLVLLFFDTQLLTT
jgi:hypothetical protein